MKRKERKKLPERCRDCFLMKEFDEITGFKRQSQLNINHTVQIPLWVMMYSIEQMVSMMTSLGTEEYFGFREKLWDYFLRFILNMGDKKERNRIIKQYCQETCFSKFNRHDLSEPI